MGIYLFPVVAAQLACAFCAVKLRRPAIWLQLILLIPVIGSLLYCAFEIRHRRQSAAGAVPAASTDSAHDRAVRDLGFRAGRVHTVAERRALAEQCLRLGRFADARLLYKSCLEGRHMRDPVLIDGLERATAMMGGTAHPTGAED